MHTAALIAVGAVALANWWSRLRHDDRLELWTKPLATVLVIVVAATGNAPAGDRWLAVAALVCCLAGDVALLSVVDQFVAGLAAFLVGHLVFIALFVRLGLHHPWMAVGAGAAMAVIATTMGRRIVAGARAKSPALSIPVMAYLAVISAMAIVGWATGQWWVIAGATAFVVSDSILGWGEFVRDRRWMHVGVMVTYHAALVGLALGVA